MIRKLTRGLLDGPSPPISLQAHKMDGKSASSILKPLYSLPLPNRRLPRRPIGKLFPLEKRHF